MASDMHTLKSKMRTTWMAGDFGKIAESIESHARDLIQRLHVTPGTRVLDVACGTGNVAIPAAEAGADVTGVDLASNLLEQARKRAEHEGVQATFDEGDAEDLPYDDASFDLVVSMYGAMFAPRPERAAAEMVRVTRPGGRIAMTNWVPTSFIAEFAKATAKHVPPPEGVPSPLLWGDEATVRERFADGIDGLELTRVVVPLAYPFAVEETVEHYRTYYGPTQRAFDALDEEGQAALKRDLERVWDEHNQADDGSTYVESEYLQVVATKA